MPNNNKSLTPPTIKIPRSTSPATKPRLINPTHTNTETLTTFLPKKFKKQKLKRNRNSTRSSTHTSAHKKCTETIDSYRLADSGGEPDQKQPIDYSHFVGNLPYDDREDARHSWKISDGNNFRIRSKNFSKDKSKITAGRPLMDLVAVDWFKHKKRIDHVARSPRCAAQVASEKGLFSFIVNLQIPASDHYSMVFYFITNNLKPGSLLQRFVDGDDKFKNSKLKLIPSIPKIHNFPSLLFLPHPSLNQASISYGSWIVRKSVGSTPCLLGKAVDCTYIRGPSYLEIDVNIGSSRVANGVLGLVTGAITSAVVDMAFLLQGDAPEELPERLIGAVRVSHLELSSAAIVPKLEPEPRAS
uniref:Protein ENHANCED DISEASE RESISTANCE 2 C-terminal domain-containing protein n=1 Tax=Kalanchoe fedtschenkoi TaxID=63787 RepID=A0A7N0UZT0_KALFE